MAQHEWLRLLVIPLIVLLAGIALLVRAWLIRRSLGIDRLRPGDFSGPRGDAFRPGANVVYFTTPYCEPCLETERLFARLQREGLQFHLIPVNLAHRADLANTYGVVTAPTVFVTDPQGGVHAGWTGTPPEAALRRAILRLVARRGP